MKLFKEHQYLLMQRESHVVLGRKAVNLWLLVLVLTATFLSIAFSEGSKSYLDEKMNDPFTNWVNIDLHQTKNEAIEDVIKKMKSAFDEDSVQSHYGFDGWQTEINASLTLVSTKGHWKLFSTLYYQDLSTDLVKAVLSEENVIYECNISPDSIRENSLGIIMTLEALQKLGYEKDHIPAFVDYYSKSIGADTLEIEMLADSIHAQAPLPLLGVVKRLPMNKEAVASNYMYKVTGSTGGDDFPLNLNHENYAQELYFFVPSATKDFNKERIQDEIPANLRNSLEAVLEAQERVQGQLKSWQDGKIWRVYTTVETPLKTIKEMEQFVLGRYSKQGVVRVYNYNEDTMYGGTEMPDDVLSANFLKLDSISAFEQFVKENFGLQIEMTQINSKKNFSAVSTMANILTFALLLFSIMSIVIFIVNMMQSYFQKVRKNLGTFKAFGISTRELTKSYIAIIVAIVISALAIALALTGAVELLLRVLGIMKDGTYSWLLLLNTNTLLAIIVILLSTVASVLIVMRRLLRQTPGDLIYDR